MGELQVIYLPLSALTPDDKNAKQHPADQVEQIKESIKTFKMCDPIGIAGDENLIIEGHGRYMALQELGVKEAPCIRLDHLDTAEKRKAYALIHNQTTMNSGFDIELLDMNLAEIETIDMGLYGFEPITEEKQEAAQEDNYDAELPAEPKAKYGEIYQLGRHRLMCGDATKVYDVEKLLDGCEADLLLTDPPYGVSVVKTGKIGGDKPFGSQKGKVGYGEKGKNKILNCNEYSPIIGDETTETALKSYEVAKNYSKNQILFGGNYFTDFLRPSKCWLVWDKENTGTFADAELAWTSFDKGVKLYRYLWNGLVRAGSRELEGKKRIHPTQKPAGLMVNIINDFAKENEIILDVFGGSGSALIACEKTNRQCFMMELSPAYIDVIINRWETLTGEKAVKIN